MAEAGRMSQGEGREPDVRHASNSSEQDSAEAIVLAALSAEIGVPLAPATLWLPGGSRVDVDGVADDRSVLVEVFAHQGILKGGQVRKVAQDALKLITIAQHMPDPRPRLILAFADAAATTKISGRSWLAESLETWGVELFVADLPAELKAGLAAAQVRQVMVNPANPEPAG